MLRTRLAGIQYMGVAGISASCKGAVARMLQYGDNITKARILTSASTHCLLLEVDEGEFVAIKSGFASGYMGEGSRTFAVTLQLLYQHGVEIDECEVSRRLLERLDKSALTVKDLEIVTGCATIAPVRWWDYVYEVGMNNGTVGSFWARLPMVIPFALVDLRVADLALSFFENPDHALSVGYRRLEDIVRKKTTLGEYGGKLFSQAFRPPGAKLEWKDIDPGESAGRVELFTGAYKAYRNPRAHREQINQARELLNEFMLLNHLFVLEAGAVEKAK